jgi:hypothetical protein
MMICRISRKRGILAWLLVLVRSRFLLQRKIELGFPQDNRKKEKQRNYGIKKESKEHGCHLKLPVAAGDGEVRGRSHKSRAAPHG